MRDSTILETFKSGLIVSCQALEDEPLHSPFIMGKMALAAKNGGAKAIRANGKKDIEEIQKQVDLPIIGIVKKNYPDSQVYITPTMEEVKELVEAGVKTIAIHATIENRPENKTLQLFYEEIRKQYPSLLLMADCSTVEEAIFADKLGFDLVATTLFGYTEHSKNQQIYKDDFKLLKEILSSIKTPVIAEGNINTPDMAKRVLELGCHSVVVGSMITRPQVITKCFVEKIQSV